MIIIKQRVKVLRKNNWRESQKEKEKYEEIKKELKLKMKRIFLKKLNGVDLLKQNRKQEENVKRARVNIQRKNPQAKETNVNYF